MTDLTLDPYKGISGAELRRLLKEEWRKMFPHQPLPLSAKGLSDIVPFTRQEEESSQTARN